MCIFQQKQVHPLVYSSKYMQTFWLLCCYVFSLDINSFQETSHLETSFEPRLDQPDKESVLGTSCPVLDSEKSDRLVSRLMIFHVQIMLFLLTFKLYVCSLLGKSQSPHQSQGILKLWRLILWATNHVWVDFPYVNVYIN